MDKDDKKRADKGTPPAAFIGMGVELIVPILLGVFIGRKIDEDGEFPLWTLLLSFLGVAVGFYAFFKEVKKIGDREDKNREDKK